MDIYIIPTKYQGLIYFRPQLRAIDQSDCRIAGGLFSIDTSLQVSISVGSKFLVQNSTPEKLFSARNNRFSAL